MSASGRRDALVGQHVAEVVEGHGVGGVQIEDLAEELLGRLVVLLPLGQLAAEEEQVDAVFLLGGERLGLVEGVFGILPAAQADVHLAQREPDGAVLVGVVEQPLGHGQALSTWPWSVSSPASISLRSRFLGSAATALRETSMALSNCLASR